MPQTKGGYLRLETSRATIPSIGISRNSKSWDSKYSDVGGGGEQLRQGCEKKEVEKSKHRGHYRKRQAGEKPLKTEPLTRVSA